jgi:AraC family transcriptional regulator
VTERQELGGIALSEVVHDCARSLPEHAHARAYLCLLLSGSYSEQLGSRTFEHPAMGIVAHPHGVEHRDAVGERGGRFFVVEASDAALEAGGARIDDVAPVADPRVLWPMLRLFREFRRWDRCSAPVAECLAAELFAGLRREPAVRGTRPPAWVARVEECVRARWFERLSLAELAAEVGVHPAHLSCTFRRFRGRSPAELQRELRVQRVCEALADRSHPLAELALEAGYADQAHMTRSFTRCIGTTPAAFRALL